MNQPAACSNANPIEHIWDMLGQIMGSLVPAPAPVSLNQLQQALLDEGESILQKNIN